MCATMEGEIGLSNQTDKTTRSDVNIPKIFYQRRILTMATRYNGPLDGLDLSDLTGTPAPSNNPPAPQPNPTPAPPAPQPAPTGDPFDNNDDGRHGRGWGKWVIIGVIAVAIIAAMWFWVIPAVQTHLNNPSSPSQSGEPSSSQSPALSGNQDNDQNGDGDTDDNGGQTDTKLTVAEEAALLDPWFKGIPASNWETKTTAQLGVDTTTPLGSFVKNFAVVLSDGTVVARGTSETGDSVPTIISDYTVPTEWNGTAVVIAENDLNSVLLVSKLPEDTNQSLYGTTWQFAIAEETYVYTGKGHSNPPAAD